MLFTLLLVVHALIATLLVVVILMQRSEGGGLTSGGSPSGLMSARGAADFLTRVTAILATLFIGLSIVLAALAATRHNVTIDTSRAVRTPVQTVPDQAAPQPGDPLAGAAQRAATPGSNTAAPAPDHQPAGKGSVPLAQ